MERLDDIYNNPEIDDNTLLMRILNTILEIKDSLELLMNILHYTDLLKALAMKAIKNGDFQRENVKFVVEMIDFIENKNPEHFEIYCKVLKSLTSTELTENHLIFLMCYCRAKWEVFYEKHIVYSDPKYAILDLTQSKWCVFLEAFKNNQYRFIKK